MSDPRSSSGIETDHRDTAWQQASGVGLARFSKRSGIDAVTTMVNRPQAGTSPEPTSTLSPEMRRAMDAYWRSANHLFVGQLYLYDNPLLKRPLALSDVKPLIVGHWGTTSGQKVASTYLDGRWSAVSPDVDQDEAGMKKLFTQFSFPGGISSHVASTTRARSTRAASSGTH